MSFLNKIKINAIKSGQLSFISRGYAAKWFPDSEFIKQFEGAVMYPDPITSKWKVPPYNAKIQPIASKDMRNLVINFGPQHPAAHGKIERIFPEK